MKKYQEHNLRVISMILKKRSIYSLLPLLNAEKIYVDLNTYHQLLRKGRTPLSALLISATF